MFDLSVEGEMAIDRAVDAFEKTMETKDNLIVEKLNVLISTANTDEEKFKIIIKSA